MSRMLSRSFSLRIFEQKKDCSQSRMISDVLSCFISVVDPLVGSIANQYINDRQEHDKIAKEWTKRFAT